MGRPRTCVAQLYSRSEVGNLPSSTPSADSHFDLRTPPTVLLAPSVSGYDVVLRGREPGRLQHASTVRGYLSRGLLGDELSALRRLDLLHVESPHARMELIALLRSLALTDRAIGELVGEDATTVCRWRRLHQASPELRDAVCNPGPFSLGHARILLGLAHADQVRWVQMFDAAERRRPRRKPPLTVAAFARQVSEGKADNAADVRWAEDALARVLATEVLFERRGTAGVVKFAWSSPEELAGLLEGLLKLARPTMEPTSDRGEPRWLEIAYRDNDELQELVGGAFEEA